MAAVSKTKSKNKTKNVNKTKIFLANPSKPKCPSLEDDDLQQLERHLIDTINKSKQIPRSFATAAYICLGLESSLRAINSGKAACVLLSSSIKPRYLLGLIARNVEVKDETVPTYAQPQLENITQRIFGVKTLALVLPKDATHLGVELANWVEAHRKPKKLENVKKSTIKSKKHKKSCSGAIKSPLEQLKTLTVTSETVEKEDEMKPWGSSYISFSKQSASMDIDGVNSEEDEDKLLSALDRMAEKVKQKAIKPVEVSLPPPSPTENIVELDATNAGEDDDEFLGSYAPLTVHKICPNPNRKPRKKRKKNANKNQSKK